MHHTMFQYAENSTILAIIAYNTSAVKKAMLHVEVNKSIHPSNTLKENLF